jgi:D-arabinose 1-dehydrogenase-like Zn-dependent alcohol dehydrogenase
MDPSTAARGLVKPEVLQVCIDDLPTVLELLEKGRVVGRTVITKQKLKLKSQNISNSSTI